MPSSVPSNSRTAMLRPISPSPPRAMTRRPPSGSGGGALRSRWGWVTWPLIGCHSQLDASVGEVDAQLRELFVGRFNERRPQGAGGQAESVERRLDQDRALGAEDAG